MSVNYDDFDEDEFDEFDEYVDYLDYGIETDAAGRCFTDADPGL